MENTSYIANISYQIEDMLAAGKSEDDVRKYIEKLQNDDGENKFPENLEFVGAYFDETFGSSGCAFLDTNTGETIVGFAGTNAKLSDIPASLSDIGADIRLAGGGINQYSLYMQDMREFINNLKNKGYNITQTTGHSLGGALAMYAAAYHEILAVVTYNGAPTSVFSSWYQKLLGYLPGASRYKIENYKGEVTRFVSSEDILNKAGDFGGGNYNGIEYLINNGKGHSMIDFLNEDEQKLIKDILNNLNLDSNGLPIAEFKNGDLSLKDNDLIVENLWGADGRYSGNGVTITIDAEAFLTLKENLIEKLVNNDIAWINKAINLCKKQNNELKEKKEERNNTLCEDIVMGLEECGLAEVLKKIDESHGALLEENTVLLNLSICKVPSLEGLFKGAGWHLGGKYVTTNNIDTLVNAIKKLQSASEVLHEAIMEQEEFRYYDGCTAEVYSYKRETISTIAEAYVNLTNSFLQKTGDVFIGIGLRSGKNDGIVNAISDVLEVETENVAELKIQIETVAKIAEGLSANFSEMDEWLSKNIDVGEKGSEYMFADVPSEYKAYLAEHGEFADVVDALEAYDLQVESAAFKLAQEVATDFEELTGKAKKKLNEICDEINNFKSIIAILDIEMEKEVTRIVYGEKIMTGYNEYELPETEEKYGKLKDFLKSDLDEYIVSSKEKVLKWVDELHYAISVINLYDSQLLFLQNYFTTIVEKAIYDSQELISIINAQNLVCTKVEVMIQEIVKVNGAIEAEFKGKSIESYQMKLESIVISLNHFNTLIGECFGRKLL